MQQSLQTQIQAILSEYGEDVEEELREIVPDVAKEAVKKLRKTSPKNKGKYAKSWAQQTEKKRMSVSSVIYNREPGLPHLLEYSHALRNGGRSRPEPHIAPVEEWVNKEVVERIEEALR